MNKKFLATFRGESGTEYSAILDNQYQVLDALSVCIEFGFELILVSPLHSIVNN